MRAKHGLKPVLAEQVATRIVRLRHAIAVEVKRFPGGQDQLADRVRRARLDAENHAFGVFDPSRGAAVNAIGRIVAGIAIEDLPGVQRQHAEEQRHEHHIVVVLAQLAIDPCDDVGW